MKILKKKIKRISLLTAIIFLIQTIAPIFYEPSSQPPPGQAWILGKVLDKDTKNPIAQALVVAVEVDNDIPTDKIYYQKTNSKGVYIIARIEMGKEYWVFCYPPEGSDYALDLTPRKIKVTTQYPRADFELEVGGSISGTVYEADGVTPVKGAWTVSISKDSFGYATTDSNGNYKIKNLKENNSYIVGVLVNKSATPIKESISISKGETTSSINFTLGGDTSTSIKGVVKSIKDDAPIKDGVVMILGSKKLGMGKTNELGQYEIFGVSYGSNEILIVAPLHKPITHSIEINIPHTIINFNLEYGIQTSKMYYNKRIQKFAAGLFYTPLLASADWEYIGCMMTCMAVTIPLYAPCLLCALIPDPFWKMWCGRFCMVAIFGYQTIFCKRYCCEMTNKNDK
jgi:hypothetical protein